MPYPVIEQGCKKPLHPFLGCNEWWERNASGYRLVFFLYTENECIYSNLRPMESVAGMYIETNIMHTPHRKVLRGQLFLSFFPFFLSGNFLPICCSEEGEWKNL